MIQLTMLNDDDRRWATWINVCCVHANGVATTFQLSPDTNIVGSQKLECGTWVADDYAPTIATALQESVSKIVDRHCSKSTQVMAKFAEFLFDRCMCGGSALKSGGAGSSRPDGVPPCIYCRLGKASRCFIQV